MSYFTKYICVYKLNKDSATYIFLSDPKDEPETELPTPEKLYDPSISVQDNFAVSDSKNNIISNG